MQAEKLNYQETYKISKGKYAIEVTISNNTALNISDYIHKRKEFIFINSDPETVETIGRLLIDAAGLARKRGDNAKQ